MPAERSPVPTRPEAMSDIEWLVALEEIRQLKARRDRYVDAHDWDGYASLHAPDHVSHHAPDPKMGLVPEPWTSVDKMIENIRKHMPEGFHSAHHSYDPEIHFDTLTRARGIWAVTAASVTTDSEGDVVWGISYGYYFETYEKRDGQWLFTSRRWQRHIGVHSQPGSDKVGVAFPATPLKGSDAFDEFG